jgi:hypothetical protein
MKEFEISNQIKETLYGNYRENKVMV